MFLATAKKVFKFPNKALFVHILICQRIRSPLSSIKMCFFSGGRAGLFRAVCMCYREDVPFIHTCTYPHTASLTLVISFYKTLTLFSLRCMLLCSLRLQTLMQNKVNVCTCWSVQALPDVEKICCCSKTERSLSKPHLTEACYLVQNRPFDIWTLFSLNTLKGGKTS